MTSFLQTDAWMEFQKSLGRKVFDVNGVKVIKHELPFGKSYLYAPYVSSVADLRALASAEHAIFVKVEPLDNDSARGYAHYGYLKSRKTIQPSKTVMLDLTKGEDELLSAMHHKTRYNIRVAQRSGVEVRASSDVAQFWDLMQKTTARDRFSSHLREYYEKLLSLCKLYVAWKDGTPLAAAIVLMHGDTAYYLHGASDHAYRSLMAPYALHWALILKFKALSFKLYDLWGISPKYPGVTRFKLGWRGRVVEYPGAFDLVISRAWHDLYSLGQLLKK